MAASRCMLWCLAGAALVTFLAYERDEVVRDTEIILHHNLSHHTAQARSAPVTAGGSSPKEEARDSPQRAEPHPTPPHPHPIPTQS